MSQAETPWNETCPEHVILVDEHDREIGTAEKIEAHRGGGRLHRAFSVFLFDDTGALLLQQRAACKYHFPLMWTNSCCGHPRPNEELISAARRRVWEELGVEAELDEAFSFLYEARDATTELTEREFDHVLIGRFRGPLAPSPDEVADLEWRAPEELRRDVAANPSRYTPWFRVALEELAVRRYLDSRAPAMAGTHA